MSESVGVGLSDIAIRLGIDDHGAGVAPSTKKRVVAGAGPGYRFVPREAHRKRPPGAPIVRMPQSVSVAMHGHLEGDVSRERGGFLIGRMERAYRGRPRVTADMYVPATRALGTRTRLEIPPEDFFAAHVAVDSCPNAVLLGWVHSHPGLGVFLSSFDTFVSNSFFPLAHQVAIVIDPIGGDGAVFGRGSETPEQALVRLPIIEIPDLRADPTLSWSGYRR